MKKIVLAYSGGLDTSCCVHWLKDRGYEVVCFIADLGQGEDFIKIEKRALLGGASRVYIKDLRKEFVEDFIYPALQANAIYENKYLLATALGRPLIAKYLVEVDKCDGILINQLGGVPDNLTNIVSYVDGTSHVTVVANRDYMLPIAYDDNSGGAATPLLSQNTIGAMRSTFDLWFQDNVAATQTDVALTRADHVGSAPDAYIDKLILGRPGRVRFIYVKLNANQSAGSLTITLTIDGVAQAMTAVISSAVAFAVSATDAIATTAGNQLGITITTTGTWAPTTADLRAGMIVETF